jgi:type I restriction enzyme M protein
MNAWLKAHASGVSSARQDHQARRDPHQRRSRSLAPETRGVIDTVDFNATTAGQPIVDSDRLAALVKTLSQHRLGLRDVQPDLLGRAYEYLIRKFAEGQGQSAGEFYTPPEVARLMARILDPQPGMIVYDPACGSAGLLIKCHLRLLETHGVAVNEHRELPKEVAPLRLFGQEINPSTFAMSRMNAFLHDMDAEIALGDTMRSPAFTGRDGKLGQFDIVTANPMWNQDFPEPVYKNDTTGRFVNGAPPSSSADWGHRPLREAPLRRRSGNRELAFGAPALDVVVVNRP